MNLSSAPCILHLASCHLPHQPRYDLATFARYAVGMTNTISITTNQQINLAFVIRLSQDQESGEWRILLKPTQGEGTRLFCDVESMLVYLETVMRDVNHYTQL